LLLARGSFAPRTTYLSLAIYNANIRGSAWDPVILPVFKTGARHLRDVLGVFDSHTLPPTAGKMPELVDWKDPG